MEVFKINIRATSKGRDSLLEKKKKKKKKVGLKLWSFSILSMLTNISPQEIANK